MLERFRKTEEARAVEAAQRWRKGEPVTVIRSAEGYHYAAGLPSVSVELMPDPDDEQRMRGVVHHDDEFSHTFTVPTEALPTE